MNYSDIASFENSWQRSGWGSKKSQESRFKIASELIQVDWHNGLNLVDYGCNDGAFQEYLIENEQYIECYIGFDPCKEALNNFSAKALPNAISYHSYEGLLADYGSKVDIVTCIGVLQILEVDWNAVLTQIDGLVHEGSILLLSCLSLDWEGFRSTETVNTPNPSNRWHKAKDITNFMNSINYELLKSCSILPREGTYGEIGYGYDMFLLFRKLNANR